MVIYHLKSLKATQQFGRNLANRLKKGGILFLYGNLGTGKTTLTQAIAKGLDIKTRVKSPTYTLLQKHALTNEQALIHFDLYRLDNIEAILDIGYEELISNPKYIVIIEWADKIPEDYKPKDRIDIFLDFEEGNQRSIQLDFVRKNNLSAKQIEELLDEYCTPQNIRKHCSMVAQVAVDLAEKLIAKNEIIDIDLLYEAAMLHDILRLVDFEKLNKNDFTEKITDKKWQTWQELKTTYGNIGHAKAAEVVLAQKGYHEISAIIRKHCTHCIIEQTEAEELITWEDKLLYYADKRVKYDQIVTIAERFALGRMQNPHLVGSLKRSLKIEEEVKKLEQEIFEKIGKTKRCV